MPKASPIELQKVTLNLFRGDFDRLGELFPSLGAGRAIREMVRARIRRIEHAAAKDTPPDTDIEVEP